VTPRLPIAAITDEFSPDLDTALDAMSEIGMRAAELRVVWGKNILDLNDSEIDRARDTLRARGFDTVAIASPLLKCVLPNAPPVDNRFQQDVFAAKHTFDDQPRLTERAFEIAHRLNARILRVFSYWRTTAPERCFDAIVHALRDLADRAAHENLIIGLENEASCNIATAGETARILEALPHLHLKMVWDPANALVAGEQPFPEGYRRLPANRIAHVHAKDCAIDDGKPEWGPLGTRAVDWKGQIAALVADGYTGHLSLETHWPGPGGNRLEGSKICGWNLRGLAAV
jgi:L-ribulose-5-phosphate 3-epimerase